MEAKYLEEDELRIECEIRKLTDDTGLGISETLKRSLQKKFDEEKIQPIREPVVYHQAAYKNPKNEARICSRKLAALKERLVELAAKEDVDLGELQLLQTKLLHVKGRINRVAGSPAASSAMPELNKACITILLLLQDIINKGTKLNESTEELNNINVPEITDSEVQGSKSNYQEKLHLENTPKTPRDYSKIGKHASSPEIDDQNPIHKAIFPDLSHKLNQLNLSGEMHQTSQAPQGNIRSNPQVQSDWFPPVMAMDPKVCRNPSTWGIKFEGTRSSVHIERFFYRVERMAIKAYIPLNVLVDYLSLCLIGEALEWYWVYLERNPATSWESLKQDMIQRFQASRTDDDILRLLNQRKQMYPRETFQEFHDAIIRLALQAQYPLTDQEIYRILKRNMRPGLQLELHGKKDFTNNSEFVRWCVSLEDLWRRFGYNPENNISGHHNQTPHMGPRYPHRIHELSHEEIGPWYNLNSDDTLDDYDVHALYNPNVKRNHTKLQTINSKPSVNREAPIQILRNTTDNFSNRERKRSMCFNCKETTHWYQDCRMPISRVFCFGCGQEGVYKPDCMQCNMSENGKYEMKNIRDTSLVKTHSIPKRNLTEEAASNTDPELYRMRN